MYQRGSSCISKFRSTQWSYLIRWEHTIEVRYMTVFVIWIIPVVHPLLQLSMLTNLHRRQLGKGCFHPFLQWFINTKDLRCLESFLHNVGNKLIVHSSTC